MEKVAYFDKSGMLLDVFPRDTGASLYEARGTVYQADIIVFDGMTFHLDAPDEIQAIPVPDFSYTDSILELSYIFKIRCGSENDPSLIPAFVDKAASRMLWRRRDYLQVIRNYYRLGLYTAGDTFEAKYRASHRELFNRPEDEKAEEEHARTKAYFVRKNTKKNNAAAP